MDWAGWIAETFISLFKKVEYIFFFEGKHRVDDQALPESTSIDAGEPVMEKSTTEFGVSYMEKTFLQ